MNIFFHVDAIFGNDGNEIRKKSREIKKDFIHLPLL